MVFDYAEHDLTGLIERINARLSVGQVSEGGRRGWGGWLAVVVCSACVCVLYCVVCRVGARMHAHSHTQKKPNKTTNPTKNQPPKQNNKNHKKRSSA